MSDFNSKLPVFVSPTSIEFFSNDANSFRQIFTLFNPYDFPIKFKILCNKPTKYTIPDPEGLIRPKCCVDLVIRHIEVIPINENQTDKLRIQIYKTFSNDNSQELIGKKDIPLKLLSSQPINDQESSIRSGNNVNNLNTMFSEFNKNDLNNSNRLQQTQNQHNDGENVNYVVVFVGLICIILLFLPTETSITSDSTDSSIPKYLHLKFELKLFIAYILGMVTMAILRY